MAGRLHDDRRWQLAQSVVAGPHFARSPLLSKFLLYVVAETLEGRAEAVTEHKIGVTVFGRPVSYRTDEDNIVRNYARQLRRRLADHFSGVGAEESVHIHIPLGGYVPSFMATAHEREVELAARESLAAADKSERAVPEVVRHTTAEISKERKPVLRSFLWGACAVLVLVVAAWAALPRLVPVRAAADPNRVLWRTLLAGSENTFVVPPDSGLNLLEDMSHRAVPLASYIKGSNLDVPDARVNPHADDDLRTQQYTDFESLQIATTLARQPEYNPQRVFMRFPRDLRINDLKTANALIIGSACANPWAALVDSSTNFRIVPSPNMESAHIVNATPLEHESSVYESHWNEPAHETYALILFVPNLSGTGHLLAVEGLDVAGTQAAAEMLFHPESIASVLAKARRPDGGLRPFEILLRASSIQSNSEHAEIIASRIH